MTAEPDTMMEQIQAATMLGDREAARRRLAELWEVIGPAGDPLHRVTLAHFMADVQDDPADELMWDLRALEAADELTDARAQAHHASLQVEAFYPSLHLNVAECYRKLGQRDLARQHIAEAEKRVAVLPHEGLGAMTRRAIARLAEALNRA